MLGLSYLTHGWRNHFVVQSSGQVDIVFLQWHHNSRQTKVTSKGELLVENHFRLLAHSLVFVVNINVGWNFANYVGTPVCRRDEWVLECHTCTKQWKIQTCAIKNHVSSSERSESSKRPASKVSLVTRMSNGHRNEVISNRQNNHV